LKRRHVFEAFWIYYNLQTKIRIFVTKSIRLVWLITFLFGHSKLDFSFSPPAPISNYTRAGGISIIHLYRVWKNLTRPIISWNRIIWNVLDFFVQILINLILLILRSKIKTCNGSVYSSAVTVVKTTVARACNSQNICSVQKQLLRLVVV
jgi:hypothetical protein